MNKDPLYIFLHMPKCAGSTFREHIQQGIDHQFRLGFYNTNEKKLSRQDVFSEIKKLSGQEKDQLKIIYGHEVYYGIHTHFDRPVRYIVFLRNIFDRTLSFYNYQYQKRGERLFKSSENKKFSGWFTTNKWVHDEMLGYFQDYGFLEDIEQEKRRDFDELLDKFWFIGLTENADEEYLFLYQKLGINRFLKNQNISKKRKATLGPQERDLVGQYSALDARLYNNAVIRNRGFKTKNAYRSILFYMKQKRTVFSWLRNVKEALS